MMHLRVHSQNFRGSVRKSLETIQNTFQPSDCECTAFFLQDLGATGPDGPSLLKETLGDHSIYANSSQSNKSRTVAIILHKSWSITQVYRDTTGSLVGVVASRSGIEILLISAYLPSKTDILGSPDLWDLDIKSPAKSVQEEIHAIYSSLLEWTTIHPLWLIGGDLNETRSQVDRLRANDSAPKNLRKFINGFLEDSNGIDVWRSLYPNTPGFTFKNNQGSSFSRIDYFLSSPSLTQLLEGIDMHLGNWAPDTKLDHVKLTFKGTFPVLPGEKNQGRPWSIPQPRLSHLTSAQKQECQQKVNLALLPLLHKAAFS